MEQQIGVGAYNVRAAGRVVVQATRERWGVNFSTKSPKRKTPLSARTIRCREAQRMHVRFTARSTSLTLLSETPNQVGEQFCGREESNVPILVRRPSGAIITVLGRSNL